MAQLKDLLVTGASNFIGPVSIEDIQLTKVYAPTSAGGATYSIGSANYVLASDGIAGIYWKDSHADTIDNVSVDWSQQESPSDSLILTVQVNSTSASAEIPQASSTTSGIVSIGTQSIKGAKTFIDTVSATTFSGYLDGTASGVKQLNSTADNDYRILLSTNANDNNDAGSLNKNTNLRFNPTNQLLSIGGSITATGNLTITGNTNLNGETYTGSLSAGNLIVSGNANFNQIPTSPTPGDSSNDTSVATTEFVKRAFTANEAMIFKGGIAPSSTSENGGALTEPAERGWTYKSTDSGYINGILVEPGDTFIATTAVAAATSENYATIQNSWLVIQANIDGYVIGPPSSTTGGVAIYSGEYGKAITNDNSFVWDTTNKILTAEKLRGYVIVGQTPINAIGKYATAEGTATNASGTASHAEGYSTTASEWYAHAEGYTTEAEGEASHAEGVYTVASGDYSHAEGYKTMALGDQSHTEGNNTKAQGQAAHAEGTATYAKGIASHAEGFSTTALSDYSHAEGRGTVASGADAHAEGYNTTASGTYSHAEGSFTFASKIASHAEGGSTTASGYYSHAEGLQTVASETYSHAEGYKTIAKGTASHAEGSSTTASGNAAHSEGTATYASGIASHAEGGDTEASGNNAHAEGYFTVASAPYSHTEGYSTTASGTGSHAEGQITSATANSAHAEGSRTVASGDSSHAEGYMTTASTTSSHAEGYQTVASGEGAHAEGCAIVTIQDIGGHPFELAEPVIAVAYGSHAEGNATKALATASHAEGYNTQASGTASHAEGSKTIASGDNSHSQGLYTMAKHADQFVFGAYNAIDTSAALPTGHGNYIEIVGNGISTTTRSNARTLDWDGNESLAGSLLPMVNNSQTIGSTTATWKNINIGTTSKANEQGLDFIYNSTLKARIGSDTIGGVGIYSAGGTDGNIYLRPSLTQTAQGIVIKETAVEFQEENLKFVKSSKSASIVFNTATYALDFVFA